MTLTAQQKRHWSEDLPSETCSPAVAWCLTQPSYEAAWEACARPGWLLWLAGRLTMDPRPIVLAACACARTVLHLVAAGEERPRIAIEAAEAWCRGESADAAFTTAVHATAAVHAAVVADAAGLAAAADAARAAADAAADAAAAYASAEAARAAAYAAYLAATEAVEADLCQIIRKHIPRPTLT